MGESKQFISDPFILSLIGHIADALDELDMNMLLTRVTPDRAKNFAALYETGQVAGLLVIGQLTNHSQLNDLYDRGTPMVVWGARMPDSHYPVVGGDNFQGGFLAGQHLVQAGCKRIAFLGDIKHPEVQMRHAAFVKALTDVGQSFDPSLYMPLLFGDTALRAAIGQWIDQKIEFDGVFATSDVAALTIIAALQERGLKSPPRCQSRGLRRYPAIDAHPPDAHLNSATNRISGTRDGRVDATAIAKRGSRLRHLAHHAGSSGKHGLHLINTKKLLVRVFTNLQSIAF